MAIRLAIGAKIRDRSTKHHFQQDPLRLVLERVNLLDFELAPSESGAQFVHFVYPVLNVLFPVFIVSNPAKSCHGIYPIRCDQLPNFLRDFIAESG